ncbi:cytochrome c [Emcibacter sp. SYSU 3D8]|uniref:c-type cytochrome n=1 Tax=Emcibacter sp. SYSU 3D8 TaxID=3133969 RepID=UPI0031FE60FF
MKFAVRSALVAGVLSIAVLPNAFAEDKAEDAVKYREALMEVVGGHTQSFFALLQGKVSHPEDLAWHADSLAEASKRVKGAFVQNTAGSGAKTEAKDGIWAAGSEFTKLAGDFETAAANLSAAVKSKDQAAIGAAAKALGGACKGCHDKFKED